MIITGQINNGLSNYQSCECIAGVFEEGVCENDEAEGKREEDVWYDIHSISGYQGISRQNISVPGYQGINKKHIGNQIIIYKNHFFAPFFFLTQLI